jgi:hypothetical protein
VLTTGIDFRSAGYNAQRIKTFQDELIDRLQGLGGVQSAAFARTTPFSYGSYSSAEIAVDGYETAPDQQLTVDYNEVGPDISPPWAFPWCPAASLRARTTKPLRWWR